MKRIVVVANKWWEADPLCGVLIHDKARPLGMRDFRFPRYPCSRPPKPAAGAPRPQDPDPLPRMVFAVGAVQVEIWCLEELMNPAENSSSSLEKVRVLKKPLEDQPPDLVIAFGTAGSRRGTDLNGSVVVGRKVFVHDPWPGKEPEPRWHPRSPDTVVDSPLPPAIWRSLRDEARAAAEVRMISTPIAPGGANLLLAGDGFVSLGVVNITSYDDYSWADASAVRAFESARRPGQIGSIETTHGIIRSASERPFLHVSGITDTEGLFDFQVTPRVYSQNTVAAHNAGVALAWLLPDLAAAL